jgi:hypothetical protein
VVCDNLSTHTQTVFYETFSAKVARRLILLLLVAQAEYSCRTMDEPRPSGFREIRVVATEFAGTPLPGHQVKRGYPPSRCELFLLIPSPFHSEFTKDSLRIHCFML